jgi:uncharacterized protein
MSAPKAEWALVTGASSGLGREFAIALAIKGFNIVLAARRDELMQQLAARLRRQYEVQVVVEAIDLAAPDSASILQRRLDERGIDVSVLINNAAVGFSSAFTDQSADRLRTTLNLDVVTVTELAHVFGKRMMSRGRGHMLLVASTAAYQSMPALSVYGAAKAFVLSLGASLHVELGPKVKVTVLSPGLMDTEFSAAASDQSPTWLRRTRLSPVKVADLGLRALFAGKPNVIAGRINRFISLLARFIPGHRQARIILRMSEM